MSNLSKMEIKFEGKYKSITKFEWLNIPNFAVITGPNGTGKSQLLQLIYETIINQNKGVSGKKLEIGLNEKEINPSEVTFLKGEWQLQNTSYLNLFKIQQRLDTLYNNFIGGAGGGNFRQNNPQNVRTNHAYEEVHRLSGKSFHREITKEEFLKFFPENLIEQDSQLSLRIGEFFLNYRVSEIELLAKGTTESDIIKEIGQRPWDVMREIIRESKLPFDINDPSSNGVRDDFHLRLTHQILKEEINFDDLSSGEKVLISLVFYLYNSQERNIFPKLLLLDEPDAHLHPTMTQHFINVIKNLLVDKYGVQVIMTTHSPSTVMLSPEESIFEMSRTEPRIRKSPSKNHAVSLLTSGLVYVGEGTRYFLVEDSDDVDFYSYTYNKLTNENQIDSNIPLVFISGSTKDKSGGKDAVKNWVGKLKDSGLTSIVQGLIDSDGDNADVVSEGIYKIERYSIENYLIDPILIYAALLDKEKNPIIEGIDLSMGEEYKLRTMPDDQLQRIADYFFSLIEPELHKHFSDFNVPEETQRIEVDFINGTKLKYPIWIINRRGKTIINNICNGLFSSHVNLSTQFKAYRKMNMFPMDLVEKLNELKQNYIN